MSNSYTAPNFSPARALSPHIRSTPDANSLYLAELFEEHQKLVPFIQVLPFCSRLLNQEIMRVSGHVRNQGYNDLDMRYSRSPSPMPALDATPNSRGMAYNGWSRLPHEKLGGPHGMNIDFPAAQTSPNSHIVKKIMRLEIPVDMYPTFNFVGRLLGPRGNSLKRLEASTGCRVFIRGKGSIKDSEKEDTLRGKPGYEHLNDPLHILVEAELPSDIVDMRLRHAQELIQELLKPVDESHDMYKRQQLRELALLNSNLREESPGLSGSVSPFSSHGMKRAKTGL